MSVPTPPAGMPETQPTDLAALVPHVTPWGTACECGVTTVTAGTQQLIILFDGWHGDKAYREHDDVMRWADELLSPLLAELERTSAERDDYREGQRRALRDRERVEQEMDTRLAETWRERDAASAEADQLRVKRDEARELLHTIWHGTVNSPARERWLRLIADVTPAAVPQPAMPAMPAMPAWMFEHPPATCGYLAAGFVAGLNAAVPQPDEPSAPAEVIHSVACPKCEAKVDEHCRGLNPGRAHIERGVAYWDALHAVAPSSTPSPDSAEPTTADGETSGDILPHCGFCGASDLKHDRCAGYCKDEPWIKGEPVTAAPDPAGGEVA